MTMTRILAVLFLLFAFMGGAAYADNFNITTGNAYFQDIGNDGQYPGNYDKLNFAEQTFSLVGGYPGALWLNVPIEYMTFTVGTSCAGGVGCQNNNNGTAALDFTINGQLFTVNVPWHVDISYSDTLTLYGTTMRFDLPGYDLVLWTKDLVVGPKANGTYNFYLNGAFGEVPEPGTMLLLGGGLAALPWIRRKLHL